MMTRPQNYFYNTYIDILYRFSYKSIVGTQVYIHNTVRYCHMTICDMII